MKTSLFAEKGEIEKILREAIDAFGTVYERAGVKSVNVVFVPQSPRNIGNDSRPHQDELTFQQRRTMRYETSGLIDSYELILLNQL